MTADSRSLPAAPARLAPRAGRQPGVVADYRRRAGRRTLVVAALLAALAALAVGALLVGGSSFTAAESWRGLWRWIGGESGAGQDGLVGRIVWRLRMPRILVAVVAGAGLTVAGALMQTILRNPLASPFTLGISSAASSGAAVAIVLKTSAFSFLAALPYQYTVTANAFLFAAAGTVVIYLLTLMQRVTPETIVLLGVAMSFFFAALTALIQYVGNPDALAELAYWMFGSLDGADFASLPIIAPVVVVAGVVSYRWMWDLNAMAVDDDTATSSGVNVARIRLGGLIVASVTTAVIVSFLGPIGFIGLVAPHLGRLLVGGDHRFLLPVSTLIGACLLLVADTVARTVVNPLVLPVGIVTAFIGVPVLVGLMLRRRTEHW